MTEATLPAVAQGHRRWSASPTQFLLASAEQGEPLKVTWTLPLRSAHTTVPKIRHARGNVCHELNFKQRVDLRLAATVT